MPLHAVFCLSQFLCKAKRLKVITDITSVNEGINLSVDIKKKKNKKSSRAAFQKINKNCSRHHNPIQDRFLKLVFSSVC
ncbi:CLUMA_CG011437, isoform A [Clunio marinus]|uniref:CLUMA_CG011437, isoform A n=1 Tax=Clunio marinus TaxID=568069 RepID=A0A1J1IET5_9DIPT|nr:CLUMA_CG011437, isoform A [Clunio marinus]